MTPPIQWFRPWQNHQSHEENRDMLALLVFTIPLGFAVALSAIALAGLEADPTRNAAGRRARRF
jgi:hypothetical protein